MGEPRMRVVGFGQRLRVLREARTLGQRELGRLAGLSAANVCRYELENGLPDANALVALADALDVSADELLGRPDRTGGNDSVKAALTTSITRLEEALARLRGARQRLLDA